MLASSHVSPTDSSELREPLGDTRPAVQGILLPPLPLVSHPAAGEKAQSEAIPSGASQPVHTATSTATADGQKP